MSTTGRYKSYKKADVVLNETGYLKAWITPIGDFTTLNDPVLSATPLIGEINTISTSHVWAAQKGAIAVYCDKKALEAPGETTGEIGSLRMVYHPKIYIIGDGAVVKEIVDNLTNDESIVHLQNSCESPTHIQFGCDCSPCEVEKVAFASGTLEAGKVGYEITLKTYKKLFYNGTITELA